MGLIKAALGSVGSVLADQWKEYFYCDSMASNVLVTKGKKRTSSRNSNTKGSDNIISNGSVVAVNEGQCMMIVEQGKIVEFAAEAGRIHLEFLQRTHHFPGRSGGSGRQLGNPQAPLRLRRRYRQGSAGVLLQPEGTGWQQVWHPRSHPLPCCGQQHRSGYGRFHPLQR